MYPYILRNTLLSPLSISACLSMEKRQTVSLELAEILYSFQPMKGFASEIHTETNLVKPILRTLGYSYESKPKFFETHVKGPDVALFGCEEEAGQASKAWGTEAYFRKSLVLVLIKRYGRTLQEGVSGFFLDFESRLPLYQILYLLKRSKTPWGILTNGRNWILLRRPRFFETSLLELDLEAALEGQGEEVFHLFRCLFSCEGLNTIVPSLLDEERGLLSGVLSQERRALQRQIKGLKQRVEIYPGAALLAGQFLPGTDFASTAAFLRERKIPVPAGGRGESEIIQEWSGTDICSYLFLTRDIPSDLDLAEALGGTPATKEDLLSLKVLDMTPAFGAHSVRIVENLCYLSFLLPYRERSTFVAEWEHEARLRRYIVDNIMFGIERCPVAYDVLRAVLDGRFGSPGPNYRQGNPLVGLSIRDLMARFHEKSQPGLFGRNPQAVIDELYDTHRQYISLSDRIREDAALKEELGRTRELLTGRVRDALDVMTAMYFSKRIDDRKLEDMVAALGAHESGWTSFTRKDWFVDAKELARKRQFFHMELEFPLLMTRGFDIVVARPGLTYLWEEDFPEAEAVQAYVRRGMQYLKPDGAFILIAESDGDALASRFGASKRYDITPVGSAVVIRKRQAAKGG